MSKLSPALVATILLVPSAALSARTPETVNYELTRAGNVSFPHKLHAARGCKACHPAAPVKIELDRDKAHALCKACHETLSKGPTRCDGCHRR